MLPVIRVELLGALRVLVGTTTVDRFRTRKVGELLAYLAFHRDRICTREELADLLWADEYDITVGLNRLTNALSTLRAQLEPPGAGRGSALDAGRYSIRLRPDTCSVDVLEFRAAIKASSSTAELEGKIRHLERAFQLYRGDFAPTLASDWIYAERVRLQDSYSLLLAKLRDLWSEAGDFSLAIEHGNQLVALDPYSERSHAELIRLYLIAGREAAAHDQLAALREKLKDMDTEPSRETLALLNATQVRPVGFSRAVTFREAPEEPTPGAAAHTWTGRPSLPLHVTQFFGREEEIAQGLELLKSPGVRLISLIGPGGSGKTRLAIEIARAANALYEGAVYFCALADVTNPSLIGSAVLAGIGLSDQSQDPIVNQIAAGIGPDSAALVVLDNVEQIIDEVASFAQDLLAAIPGLKIISTSRRNLSLTAETGIHVLPLPLPGDDLSPKELIAIPSVALFVDRAQHVNVEFQLSARNGQTVAELCRKLDGMPLAIELAATWAKTLSPQQMLHQLARRFEFLVTRRRDVPLRHQRMLAIIESSYMQLDPPLRQFLAKLSVFEGGWSLEAAQAVCEAPSAMAWLQELLDRTLVTSSEVETEDGGCTMRLGMLETIREFCLLQVDPEDREHLLVQHAAYYASHAESEGQGVYEYKMKMPLKAFIADLPNYRLALNTSLERSDWRGATRILFHTYQGWEDLVLFDELLNWLDRIPETGMDDRTYAFFLRHRARCYMETGRPESAIPLFEECLERFGRLGEQDGIAATLSSLALAHLGTNQLESAREWMDRSLKEERESENNQLRARILAVAGTVFKEAGDVLAAQECYQKVLRLSGGRGHIAAAVSNYLAELEMLAGRYLEADVLSRSALGILKSSVNQRHERLAWLNLGRSAIARGMDEAAQEYFHESLEAGRTGLDAEWLCAMCTEMAKLAAKENDARSALVFVNLATSNTQLVRTKRERFKSNAGPSIEALSKKLGEAESRKAEDLGRSMNSREAAQFIKQFLEKSIKSKHSIDI